MIASQRYEKTSEWRVMASTVIRPSTFTDSDAVELVHETADIRDTQGGQTYSKGVHRVYAKYVVTGKSAKKVKTFYGETAWTAAIRLYEDIYFEYQREMPLW